MKELKPTKHLLDSFMTYRAKTMCSKCGQKLPKNLSKLQARFFLVKELKGNMIKVKMLGRKTPFSIHRTFFNLPTPKE